MFAVRVATNHYLVADRVGMFNASGILACIVLKDKSLLTFLHALPVSLKGDIEDGISPKDELCRRSSLVVVWTVERIA